MCQVPKRSPTRRFLILAVIGVAMGAALRVACAWRCCVGYDEVFVMGVGLDEITGSLRSFFIDVPLRRSDAVTPLWWWVQIIPCAVAGDISLVALRVLPVILSVCTLALTWRVAAARIGRGPASILVLLVACSDVLAFANARGEFAESLLMSLALPAACLVGDTRRPVLKGGLWLALLLTHLGKGVFLVGGLISAECVYLLLTRTRRRTVSPRSLAASALIAVVPTLTWLFMVNRIAFSSGPVITDAGERTSVWHALKALTVGYVQTKSYAVGSRLDATQAYLDGRIWPATTILAVPLALGLVSAAVRSVRQDVRGRRRMLSLSLLPWVLLGGATIVGRGIVGARFHLLYLPAAWVAASIGLWHLRHTGARTVLAAGLLWIVHLAVAFSWSSWSDRALAISGTTLWAPAIVVLPVALAAWWAGRARPRWLASAAAFGCVLIPVLLVNGPWRWGPAGRFEPMAQRATANKDTLLQRIDRWRSGNGEYPQPYDGTLYISLAHYFLKKDNVTPADIARAVRYAELETRRVPNDPRAWFYLGFAYQQQGRAVEEVRSAYQCSYDLRPEPIVAEFLANLPE